MRKQVVPIERITRTIFTFREQKVMLSQDLAALYGVTVRALTQAGETERRSLPEGLRYQFTSEEFADLKSQIVISKRGRGGRRHHPYAFTEQGVAMLSSVLRSARAVKVNIAIMRAFVQLRGALENNRALARKFAELEARVGG
ncbi:MAG: ORF6N domain-containing protein, partial [Chthoniobacterales bacterium]|nr:ORF6N domain-containing protein [Chthoniobacterales bacterium]